MISESEVGVMFATCGGVGICEIRRNQHFWNGKYFDSDVWRC